MTWRRIYVPLATAAIVLGLGNWWAQSTDFDPLTAAQNPRIVFQTSGAAGLANLDPAEAAEAERVLDRARPWRPGAAGLLFVGNSQSLAIMDARPGELTTPQWLQVLLERRSPGEVDVHLASLPNLTQTEALILLADAVERAPGERPALYVGAQVLEEYRALGVREEIAARARAPRVAQALRRLVEAHADLPAARRGLDPVLAREEEPAVESPGRRLERATEAVFERMPLFANRTELRNQVGLAYYDARNLLLGIRSSTARPVPEATWRGSIELLELLLRFAREHDVSVVLYLAPIRPIEPNPNLPADMARFRRELPALAARYGTPLVDLVDLVPEPLWTNYPDDAPGTAGERDFAHFTGEAHRLVAEALLRELAQVRP